MTNNSLLALAVLVFMTFGLIHSSILLTPVLATLPDHCFCNASPGCTASYTNFPEKLQATCCWIEDGKSTFEPVKLILKQENLRIVIITK